MNYRNIYYKIIENAKKETENGNRCIGYFEKHHILPKSLGGSNDENNLVKLSAKEHFICHWLLVKMHNKGSEERNKMLYAFWRMKSNPNNNNQRYINSRAYEKLRIEFSKNVSIMNKHFGTENSQFGKHWYTDLRTGESKSFIEKPDEFWINGRNWFENNANEIYSIKTKKKIFSRRGTLKFEEKRRIEVIKLWNDFLKSDFDSVNSFNKDKCPSMNLHALFRKFIPEYKNHKINLTKFNKCPLV